MLDVARAAGRCGAARRRRRRRAAGAVHDDLGLRRRLDEPQGHADEPGVARADRRLDRGGDARPCLRRPGRLRRLRQDPARRDDGDGPAQLPERLRLRRRDAARHLARPRRHDPHHLRERRRGAGRTHDRSRAERARPRLRADARLVPRPVHREHDGDGVGDARPRAARLGDAAGRLCRTPRAGAPGRTARRRDRARRRTAAARSGHAQVARECRRRGRRDRRLDQRRAAPAGDRPRSRHPLHARRCRRGLRAHAADRQPAARRQVPRGRSAPGRRRAVGAEGAARRRLSARRRARVVGSHAGRGARVATGARWRGRAQRVDGSAARPAASSCSRATSRRTVR